MTSPLDDPRGYLRQIVESSDPNVTPGDRLRALQMLSDAGALGGRCNCTHGEVAALSDEQLDEALLAYGAPLYRERVDVEFMESEIERRVAEEVAEFVASRTPVAPVPTPTGKELVRARRRPAGTLPGLAIGHYARTLGAPMGKAGAKPSARRRSEWADSSARR